MRVRSIPRGLVLVAAILGGLAASMPLAGAFAGAEGSGPGLDVAPLSCQEQQSGIISIIGRLAVGHLASELTKIGSVASEYSGGHDPDRIVLFPSGGFAVDPGTALKGNPAVAAVGLLRAQTADLSLRSCHYRLADNARAKAIAASGSLALLQAGLLTQNQLADPSTTFLLTDDPLDASKLDFAVLLATPVGAAALQSHFPLVAEFDRSTLSITWTGAANWYQGQ